MLYWDPAIIYVFVEIVGRLMKHNKVENAQYVK